MGLERMGTHSESCYKWHLECAVSRYEALRARVSELEAAGRAVLNCNDQVCAFGHGGCPAQCRADEMLRKAIRCAGNKDSQRKEEPT